MTLKNPCSVLIFTSPSSRLITCPRRRKTRSMSWQPSAGSSVFEFPSCVPFSVLFHSGACSNAAAAATITTTTLSGNTHTHMHRFLLVKDLGFSEEVGIVTFFLGGVIITFLGPRKLEHPYLHLAALPSKAHLGTNHSSVNAPHWLSSTVGEYNEEEEEEEELAVRQLQLGVLVVEKKGQRKCNFVLRLGL